MTDGPLVSVIIPTYNRNEILLSRALPSVLAQTYQNFEVLIVADGMTPYELMPLQQGLAQISDMRVSLYNIERQQYPDDPGQRWCVLGLNARNFGLDKAQGDWIAGLDDDDAMAPEHIEVLLNAALDRQADFAYGRSVVFWHDGRMGSYGNWPPGHFQFCDGAYVYKRSLNYRYEAGCIGRGLPEDGDLWDRMVAGGVAFTFVEQNVHYYYPNPR